MKILFIGEIVARPGRQVVKEYLPEVLSEERPDLVIANAENLAHGRGATVGTLEEMKSLGIDFFTGGDHLFWHRGFKEQIEGLPLIRPANINVDFPVCRSLLISTKIGNICIGKSYNNFRYLVPRSNSSSELPKICSISCFVHFHCSSPS